MCQRWSGGVFGCFSADAAAVTIAGEVTRYRSVRLGGGHRRKSRAEYEAEIPFIEGDMIDI